MVVEVVLVGEVLDSITKKINKEIRQWVLVVLELVVVGEHCRIWGRLEVRPHSREGHAGWSQT